jgi:signal transduction histidine kinase
MAQKKLAGYVTFNNKDTGESRTFGPDDELPDWAAEQAQDVHYAESEDDAADLPVAGPGQVAGEGMSDEEKAEARKAADRKRKADQRAAAKKQAEDAAALQAAQEAEAQRQAEAEAAAEAERQRLAGGGS